MRWPQIKNDLYRVIFHYGIDDLVFIPLQAVPFVASVDPVTHRQNFRVAASPLEERWAQILNTLPSRSPAHLAYRRTGYNQSRHFTPAPRLPTVLDPMAGRFYVLRAPAYVPPVVVAPAVATPSPPPITSPVFSPQPSQSSVSMYLSADDRATPSPSTSPPSPPPGSPQPVQDFDHVAALHQRRFEYRHYDRRVRALSAVYASGHVSLQNLSHLHTFTTLNLLRMLQFCLNTNHTDIPIQADHQQPLVATSPAALLRSVRSWLPYLFCQGVVSIPAAAASHAGPVMVL